MLDRGRERVPNESNWGARHSQGHNDLDINHIYSL